MRIGEFTEKHNITQDTIRHYLDMGLLITKKDGAHYRFDESDSIEIQNIIELKQLGFSLAEIQEVLSFHRLAGDKTDEYKNYYLSTLENKREEVRREQQRYEKINSDINEKISLLKINKVGNMRNLGIPMSSMSIIRCPNCKNILKIYDAIIEDNMIINGSIKCECDYSAIIEKGIYIDEGFMKKNLLHGKKMPSKKEFLDAASSKFINFFYDGMAILTDNIQKYGKDPKYILELEACGGTFLMPYIKYLPEDATYIIIGNDKDRLMNLKNNIELHHNHRNFLFLYCDIEDLPIMDSSIDIIVDHWMTKNYAMENHKFLLDIVGPLLKESGLLVGGYPYFQEGSNDLYTVHPEVREYWDRTKILKKLKGLNMIEMDTSNIGPIVENNPYSPDIRDKELYLQIYSGVKDIKQK